MKRAAHTLGGASSDPDHKDGTVKAARIAIECLRDGKTALGAVLKATLLWRTVIHFNFSFDARSDQNQIASVCNGNHPADQRYGRRKFCSDRTDLGLMTGYTMGGVIHALLVIAIVVVLVCVIQGRKPT